jgi:hypothetical protein
LKKNSIKYKENNTFNIYKKDPQNNKIKTKTKPLKKELFTKKVKEKTLEDKVNHSKINKNTTEKIDYYIHEQQLLERSYMQESMIDYEQLFTLNESYKTQDSNLMDKYWLQLLTPDSKSKILSNEEAEETMISIQYAHLLGQSNDVSIEQRRKFHWWIKENPALFSLFENMHPLTREVNYQQHLI